MCICEDHVCVGMCINNWAVPMVLKVNHLSLIFTSRIKGLGQFKLFLLGGRKDVKWL